MKDGGLFLHRIDHTDHFSHSDSRIPAMNFLQFSEKDWQRIAGNRFMYMNRLRVDDFRSLFEQSTLNVVDVQVTVDNDTLQQIAAKNLLLTEPFASKSADDVATAESWFLMTQKA